MKLDAKNLIALSFLIVAISIAYYFVIFIPQLETKKIEYEQNQLMQKSAEEDQSKYELDACLAKASELYTLNWNSSCEDYGTDTKEPQCSLPSYMADDIEARYTELRNDCFKKFPQN